MKRIPVIIDTDIGTDIDDTWAVLMALNSPELDIKLIVSSTGDTILRAALLAKFLDRCGRTDIPIGIGIPLEVSGHYQKGWIGDYSIERYPGRILEDGVGGIIETIMSSSEEVTVIGMAPLPNIGSALRREPVIAKKSRFVGMHGSLFKGYFGADEAVAEFNVLKYPYSCRDVFAASWDVTITPLDTCGLVQLKGDRYRQVSRSGSVGPVSVMENYRIWTECNDHPKYHGFNPEIESSILYDSVAVYLAFSEELLDIKEYGIFVTDDGYTRIDSGRKKIRCATGWKDQSRFEDLLVRRLLGNP